MARRLAVLMAFSAVVMGAGPARAQLQRQQILDAVHAAFTTWGGVECTDLRFDYKGELTPFAPTKDGAIVVYFGTDNNTWIHGTSAYYTTSTIGLIAEGNITKAAIGMNGRDILWSIGAEANHLDIQTAVTHMIPAAIGFYVGNQPNSGSLSAYLKYNFVKHTLDPEHIEGAQYAYYKDDTGCTRPQEPVVCGEAAPTPDAGVIDAGADDAGAVDGGDEPPIGLCIFHSNPNDKPNGTHYSWTTQPIPYYIYVPAGGIVPGGDSGPVGGDTGTQPTNDSGTQPTTDGGAPQTCTTSDQCGAGKVCTSEGICVATGGDDGCCRVSHTREENITYTLLLVFGIGLFLWRRRRARNS